MAVDISPFIKDAQKIQSETGIPASIILGQIMLESGGQYAGGLSGLAVKGKNLFGIKGTGTAGSVTMPTTEVYNGVAQKVNASFRAYNSYYESMLDHAKLLSKERYAKYLKSATTVNEFAQGIKNGGYATDPSYVSKLLGIISKNNLNQYDSGKISFTPIAGGSSTGSSENSTNPTDNKPDGMVSEVFYQVVRFGGVLLLFILMVVFFLQAFPSVENVTNPIKKVKGVLK